MEACKHGHVDGVMHIPCPECKNEKPEHPFTQATGACDKCGTDLCPCCPTCTTPLPLNWQAEKAGCRLVKIEATGAGLPEEPWCDYETGSGAWKDYAIAIRHAALALQERVAGLERERGDVREDIGCLKDNYNSLSIELFEVHAANDINKQRADNLQRELTEARACIRDVKWPDLVSDRDHGWGLRHAKAIDSARSERGGG